MATVESAPRNGDYDIFLSYGTTDRPWVRSLRDELRTLGLRVFLDETELTPGGNWPLTLSDALLRSRCLALVLTADTLARRWGGFEWTAYMAEHGPRSGRLVPVLLEAVDLPAVLKPLQDIDATGRDAARVARELAALVGRLDTLPEGDVRRLYIGQDLVFVLERQGDWIAVADPTGRRRVVPPPWAADTRFTVARLGFETLTREPILDDGARAKLHAHAATLGGLLFNLLFDANGLNLLRQATQPGRPRPLVSVWSGDDVLLSLPWELLHHDGRFLVRDGVGGVDLVRSIPGEVGPGALLPKPTKPFSLVVDVSAPEGSGLDYERESYRLTQALTEHCKLTPTELGTLDDLVDTVRRAQPTGIHFSGHGGPGRLLFEDDEGREDPVDVEALVGRLRGGLPDGRLPPFFYLANCNGNDPDPGEPEKGRPGSASLAARLHCEGVGQVVGYRGPILDRLSTEAEAALYAAIAEGHPTRFAVRQAREALSRPLGEVPPVHREHISESACSAARATYPFAWAQLVLYHRGHDYPLGTPIPADPRGQGDATLHRTFVDAGKTRRILKTGFIGRRRELHGLRRRFRQGQRVFVFQGLGGLGKSTLALHMLREILHADDDLGAFWCQDAETHAAAEGIAEALVGQLLEYCRHRFGAAWEPVVQQVDQEAGVNPARRFAFFLSALLQSVDRLVVYLDNLESLLVGPEATDGPADPAAFGDWREPALKAIWSLLTRCAQDTGKLHIVASCRYRNVDFRAKDLIPVSPLPPDALFRLMGWFDGLRALSTASRARLAERLDGHPRAVEFANDLIEHALEEWEERHGREWRLPDSPTDADLAGEWTELVEEALPKVQEKLRDDLLFDALWDKVLDDRARRMLYCMTLLRQPWDWDLTRELGDEGEPPEVAEATAQRLRRTSLLGLVEQLTGEGSIRRYTIHPATKRFIARRLGDNPELRLAAHRRIGTYYEARAKTSLYLDDYLEAGHHLLQAGEHERSCELLVSASHQLEQWGRAREALRILEPFRDESILRTLGPELRSRLLETVGQILHALSQFKKAIGFFEQALDIARDRRPRRRGRDPRQPGLSISTWARWRRPSASSSRT